MRWLVTALVFATGGWMLFDGVRALVVGDFVTPGRGGYAGQVGPWANLVSMAGLEPRSTLMKLIFVGYGVCYLAAAVALLLHVPGAWWLVLVFAVAGLWYLPIGTVANLAVIALLVFAPSLRTGG